MPQSRIFFSIMPLTIVLVSLVVSASLFTLLNFPEALMRGAVASMQSQPTWQVADTAEAIFADEIIDRDNWDFEDDAVFQPVGLLGSFDVGDRLSMQPRNGHARSFVVTEVRQLQPAPTLQDKQSSRKWILVIAADARYPAGPKYKFIVEEGEAVSFPLKKSNGRSL